MKENYTTKMCMLSALIGICLGCLIMFITHKEMYHHYNICQEQELLDSIAAMKDEKQWYIKEDSTGRLRVMEMSTRELDSLKTEAE